MSKNKDLGMEWKTDWILSQSCNDLGEMRQSTDNDFFSEVKIEGLHGYFLQWNKLNILYV